MAAPCRPTLFKSTARCQVGAQSRQTSLRLGLAERSWLTPSQTLTSYQRQHHGDGDARDREQHHTDARGPGRIRADSPVRHWTGRGRHAGTCRSVLVYAQISGFDANDTIDLANLDFNTALANSSYDSSTDITTLVITDTQQHTYTLKLQERYGVDLDFLK